jgi:hypothetical protein
VKQPDQAVNDDGVIPRSLIATGQLLGGDVLLCCKDEKFGVASAVVRAKTNSNYTHAAIFIGDGLAAESVPLGGVRKTAIKDLVARYDHVAVFRQPDAWTPERRALLNLFIDKVIASDAKYNLSGLHGFQKRKDVHELTLHDQLESFFKGKLLPISRVKEKYFCSELVVDCFVVIGFVDSGASFLYRSDITSPGALGRDPTFGTFYGYLIAHENYKVPNTDEFYNASTYDEIFREDGSLNPSDIK